ncbi:MAG: 30S ribosomal protein S7 [candidate division WWE3 bacterium GW2011_GWA1_46_21]|uniref:Small ribosomal subunit protein uS7 n=4 Tax=Katanobacteria TaxID=422282 RepID=A0A0G1PHB9_UNCKA|nr:MAG: 30S ribosomal protein S7 [candidate division WWE3 bacterium GW2011_GWA1_46_21]KKU48353.1 MAG: 30S ribosomal protein S7 [candidate division WWE3 bacterium GW2011_GWA2_46_9]KKU51327.1 MAG: 30S ribosomal protein S7 [candidate division WWE3 bacterium GW2011_GWC1_47_10]KKU58111.1 MAG: 30S ribosomal protein S7 [candidate division WWE3 bacterium GW2011_GWB1_47_11]
MRSKKVKKRTIEADAIYKSRAVARLINRVMLSGKKSLARDIVYKALDSISEEKKDSAEIFEQALKNVMPKQEVRSRRVGGATYQIPYPLKHDRSEALAIRWLVDVSRGKRGKSMEKKLAVEIKNAHGNVGDVIKKRDDTHKMAESNRAFAHFRI